MRWDTQGCSPTDAIRLNGIMPITFQTGQPHGHLGERVMGGRGGGDEEQCSWRGGRGGGEEEEMWSLRDSIQCNISTLTERLYLPSVYRKTSNYLSPTPEHYSNS